MNDRTADPDTPKPEIITAWQCIGCGKLEASGNCIGICEDRKVELVPAAEHARALAALEEAQARIESLEALVGALARVTPSNDGWKRSYLALQSKARALLQPR